MTLIIAASMAILVLLLPPFKVSAAPALHRQHPWYPSAHPPLPPRQRRLVSNITLCPPLPIRPPPESIHDLRSDDVKVLAALGDSITAAFAASGQKTGRGIESTLENRGRSWVSGGDPGSKSIANFISHFFATRNEPLNESLIGPSLGDHPAEFCWGFVCRGWIQRPANDSFNAALSGSLASNLQHQLDYLVPSILSHPAVSAGDWKLVTLWIGSNDLCLACSILRTSPASYALAIRAAIERLRTIPRTMVILVSLPDVSTVYDQTKDVPACVSARDGIGIFECACAFSEDPIAGPLRRQAMREHATEYNSLLRQIAEEYRSPSSPEFAVILEPGLENADMREMPVDLLSEVDCFHPSLPAHARLAEMVWENLHRKAGEKIVGGDWEGQGVYCPTAEDRIWTS